MTALKLRVGEGCRLGSINFQLICSWNDAPPRYQTGSHSCELRTKVLCCGENWWSIFWSVIQRCTSLGGLMTKFCCGPPAVMTPGAFGCEKGSCDRKFFTAGSIILAGI